ncbi:hypothetical protein P3T76_012962 [Phytophthora citrophthora]|uniref:Uncharacterized protein n=1 Tax=Phytophthora citrophthora TaxID=4793 RepID=A0AAD9G4Z5_9STRA|nr:hypothetical protein P3T76_012962 [Phytophthora citrophthora]
MGKVKQQQSNPPDSGDELAGSTLEDYFASHKVSGLVSQHLLNIPAENDVMATEKAAEAKDLKSERKSEQENYEDDYEVEASTSEVAGMSLSDYLHVKEDEKEEKLVRAGSARTLPPQLAVPKKNTPKPDVSGMSLDHYLGAVADDKQDEKKSSPKVKRQGSKSKQMGFSLPQAKATQQSFAVKGSGIIHSNSNSQDISSDEENSVSTPSSSLTPFQRRQKRKERAKAKQQRNSGSGAPVSKAILMAEAPSSKERRKGPLAAANISSHSHHSGHHSSSSSSQPPLPKLAVSPSVRTLSHKDTEDNDNTVEKLPPL